MNQGHSLFPGGGWVRPKTRYHQSAKLILANLLRKQQTRKPCIHLQESGFVKRDKDLCFQRPKEWSTGDIEVTEEALPPWIGGRRVEKMRESNKMATLCPTPPRTLSSAVSSQKEAVLKPQIRLGVQKHRRPVPQFLFGTIGENSFTGDPVTT